MHGGVAPNAALGMARLLSTLHDAHGHVTVPGFYEGVPELTTALRAMINALPFSERDYVEQTGVRPVGGEQGFTPYERLGLRPTLEINGVHSGYGGEGSKTIIPRESLAKMTFRLVAGQNPQSVLEAVCEHIKRHTPKGLSLEISEGQAKGGALLVDVNSSAVTLARKVLSHLSELDPILHFDGGSLPIVAELMDASDAEPLLVGFGKEEDTIHAPNESFSLDQFRSGFLYVTTFLSQWKGRDG